jgi:hypothetical protein
MPPPHESHHLPAEVIADKDEVPRFKFWQAHYPP